MVGFHCNGHSIFCVIYWIGTVAKIPQFFFLTHYKQVARIFSVFRLVCSILITEKPSLNRNKKLTCENCGNQTTKKNMGRHEKRGSLRTLYCGKCPYFSTTSRAHLSSHDAKNHWTTKSKINHKCHSSDKNFPRFCSLHLNRPTLHGEKKDIRQKALTLNIYSEMWTTKAWEKS